MDVKETIEQVSAASVSNGGAREIEVRRLKKRFGEDCRIIENIGDFACVVQVVLKQSDITIKFQVSGTYAAIINSQSVSPFCLCHVSHLFYRLLHYEDL